MRTTVGLGLLLTWGFELRCARSARTKANGKKKNKPKSQRNAVHSSASSCSEVATTFTTAQGVALSFSDPAAAPQLLKWARALSAEGGSVTHGQAVGREQYVVQEVNAGRWSEVAYHEYQRLAASSGHVDSARLLLQYGVGPSCASIVEQQQQQGNDDWPLQAAAATCNLPELKRLLKHLLVEHSDDDGDGSAVSKKKKRMKKSASGEELVEEEKDENENAADGPEEVEITVPGEAAAAAHDDEMDDSLMGGLSFSSLEGATSGTSASASSSWPRTLTCAALADCAGAVHLLVDAGADVEDKGPDGLTPLMVAASAGSVQALKALIEAGADANATHGFAGQTALHMAAELDQTLSIKTLCHDGRANPNFGLTSTLGRPLHAAVDGNVSEATIFALVNDCGADINALLNNDTTALYLAADAGKLHLVRALLDAGASPSRAMPQAPYQGGTHLTPAATSTGLFNEDPVDAWANVWQANADPANGATPLHAAAERGHLEVLSLLLERGASVNDASMRGITPLHSVAMHGQGNVKKIVNTLLKGGADVNSPGSSKDGATPLYYAAGLGFSEVVKALLKGSADVNLGQKYGAKGSPLHYAAGTGHLKVVKLLLAAPKINVNVCSGIQGGYLQPLHAAIAQGHTAVAELLVASGADVNTPTGSCRHEKEKDNSLLQGKRDEDDDDDEARSPLMLAVVGRLHNLIPALLTAGADPLWATPHTGANALHLACQLADPIAVKLLLQTEEGNDQLSSTTAASSDIIQKLVTSLTAGAYDSEGSSSSSPSLSGLVAATPLYLAARGGPPPLATSSSYTSSQRKEMAAYVKEAEDRLACAVLLLDAGADTNVGVLDSGEEGSGGSGGGGSNGGVTPLLAAIESKHEALVKLLLERGADPNLGAQGAAPSLRAPLLLATLTGPGTAPIAKLLLNAGANCQVVIGSRAKPSTLVDLARQRRDFDLLQLLDANPDCHVDLSQL